MSKIKQQKPETQAVPFFARFLEAQRSEPSYDPRETLKYPSDQED